MNREFVAKNNQEIFTILDKLNRQAGLRVGKDCGKIHTDASLQASRASKFWVSEDKMSNPVVKRVLKECGL